MSLSPTPQRGMVPTWKVRNSVVAAGVLAVTIAEIKAALKITNALEDDYLLSIANAAQEVVQLWTGRHLTTTTMIGNADNPLTASTWWEGVQELPAVAIFGNPRGLDLPGVPLLSVQSFTFVDIDNNSILFDPSAYYVDTTDKDRPGRIVLKYTTTYPAVPKEIAALVIAYTTGYGGPAAVPYGLKQAVLRVTAYLYANRGDCGSAEDIMKASGALAFANLYKVPNL